ncbi:MAG: phosphatidylglycerophosphatase A [Firmicutes bacterium HGW-Firmicutes-14]|nr:MAG: phosphatidylglycerophosphatase A [Firmicutes bacterium HGW-Firmicutes-14]
MRNNLIIMFATGLGLGLVPRAPGTVGTVLGLVFAVLVPDSIYLIVIISVLGVWVSGEAEKILGEHDCPKIVIDEIAGLLIAAYYLQGYYLIAAFLLFRFFDILKPFPINRLQRLPGGFGVMADDLAAGLLTNLIIHFVIQLTSFSQAVLIIQYSWQ